MEGTTFAPCHAGYHPRCIKAGTPFTSRRRHGAGLVFPNVAIWPNFVCEVCTVRAVLRRPLGHAGDLWLLQLERMRLLDMAHSWAEGTLAGYQSQFRKMVSFESAHPGLTVLPRRHLEHPPRGKEVTLAWTELNTSVEILPARGTWGRRTPVYDSIRKVRSAASFYQSWDFMTAFPSGNYFDNKRHVIGPCRATDSAAYSLYSRGLAARIGSNPRPATALLGRHVMGLDRWMYANYAAATTSQDRRQWALAGLANSLLWLGWLRGGEAFRLQQKDFKAIYPSQGSTYDLPRGVGAILLQMGETKTDRSSATEIAIAYKCLSGLSAGEWAHRLYQLEPWDESSGRPLFCHSNGTPWSSHFYRHTFLYPGLELLRAQGDSFLSFYDGSTLARTLAYAFWSLHCYRRGARTHSQRSQPDRRHKKASKIQIYEHGRWNLKRGSEDIDVLYREWTLYDKLRITLFCH